jgi:hypothetical protein
MSGALKLVLRRTKSASTRAKWPSCNIFFKKSKSAVFFCPYDRKVTLNSECGLHLLVDTNRSQSFHCRGIV